MEIEAGIIEEDNYSGKIELPAHGHKLIRGQAAWELLLTAITWQQSRASAILTAN